MQKYFVCGPNWCNHWVETQFSGIVRTDSASQCDLYVISLFGFGTPKGLDFISKRRLSHPPAHAKTLFILIDVYTDNDLLVADTFDYVVHPYANPPDNIRGKLGTWHVPVWALYHHIVKKCIQESVRQNPVIERSKMCVMVSSHPTESRLRIINELGDQLEVFGTICGGPAIPHCEDPELGYVKVCDIMRASKYVLVVENMFEPGYVSEKIMLALGCGAIPIYCGAPDVDLYVKHKSILQFELDAVDAVSFNFLNHEYDPDYMTDYSKIVIDRVLITNI